VPAGVEELYSPATAMPRAGLRNWISGIFQHRRPSSLLLIE
jgi:hypothetical protein